MARFRTPTDPPELVGAEPVDVDPDEAAVRWLRGLPVLSVVVGTTVGMILSYSTIADAARFYLGYAPLRAHLYPLAIDAPMLAFSATIALEVATGQRRRGSPLTWALLLGFTGLSMAANAAAHLTEVHWSWVAPAMAVIPSVSAMITFERVIAWLTSWLRYRARHRPSPPLPDRQPTTPAAARSDAGLPVTAADLAAAQLVSAAGPPPVVAAAGGQPAALPAAQAPATPAATAHPSATGQLPAAADPAAADRQAAAQLWPRPAGPGRGEGPAANDRRARELYAADPTISGADLGRRCGMSPRWGSGMRRHLAGEAAAAADPIPAAQLTGAGGAEAGSGPPARTAGSPPAGSVGNGAGTSARGAASLAAAGPFTADPSGPSQDGRHA
jgi:hypothetical protein